MSDFAKVTEMHKSRVERDGKRARREIANSNERKRMQTINSGFLQLKTLLPLCEDDKISKSAVLQQAVNHIKMLETDRNHVRRQNTFLIRRVAELKKSLCGASCVCEGKCCSFSSTDAACAQLSESAELGVMEEISATDRDLGLHQTLNDLTQRLSDAQTELSTERKRSEVMESFISRILCQSAEVVSGSDSGVVVASSQEEVCKDVETEWKVDLKKELIDILPDEKLSTTTSRKNLDTIVEAIRHLEGGDGSASLVKRLRLASSNVPDDESLKFLYSHDGAMIGAAGECISFAMESNQFVYTVDDQFQVRQDDGVNAPAVAAFELVCGEQCGTMFGDGDVRRVNPKPDIFIPAHVVPSSIGSGT